MRCHGIKTLFCTRSVKSISNNSFSLVSINLGDLPLRVNTHPTRAMWLFKGRWGEDFKIKNLHPMGMKAARFTGNWQ